MIKIVIWEIRENDGWSYHSSYENARAALIRQAPEVYEAQKRNSFLADKYEENIEKLIRKIEYDLVD